MGLNDDVEEGLEPYVTPLQENPNQPDAPTINLVTKTSPAVPADNDINAVPTRKIFGSPIVPNELPNLNAEFTIITDKENQIQDMVGMRDAVSGSCGVCQEDVNGFDALAPGFVNDNRPLGYYTEAKSKTQFTQTLNNMDASIEVGIETLTMQTIALNEKIVPIYHKTATDMAQAIVKNQTKAHLIYSDLVLLRHGETPAVVQQYLSELNCRIPYLRNLDHEYPAHIDQMLDTVSLPDNRTNICNLVQSDRSRVVQAIQVGGEIYEFSEQEPYLVPTGGEVRTSFDRTSDFLDYFCNGIDIVSINYMQRLCQVSVNITQAMVASSNLLTEMAKKPTPNLKERIDFVTRVVAVNQKYARQNAYLLSFMHDYFNMYDSMVQTALDLQAKSKT